jgi:hypothetical protein
VAEIAELRGRSPLAVTAAALVLIGAGAAIVSTAFDAAPTAEVVGGNPGINAGAGDLGDISSHNSPTLVRSPVDGAILAISNRIDTPRFSCALHVSSDGGSSWRQAPIPVPRGEEPKCYAPDVAFGADGTLYLSFVTLRGFGNVPHAAWLATSTDGGRTLSKPVKVLGPLAFQVRLLADPVTPRRVYLSWLQGSEVALLKFPQTGNPIRFTRSDDGGRTWQRPARVSPASRQRVVAPSAAVGPRGELYVLYLDLGNDRLDYEGLHKGRGGPPYRGRWKLVLARSSDRGRSWEETVVDGGLVPTERFIVFIPPFPSLAVDRRSGRIYAAYQDGRLGDADVRVWSSGDGGASWRSVRVNDTPEHDGTSQYLPKLAVAPNGRVDVVYYDRRADPRNRMSQVSWQYSGNGGKGFGRSVRLTERPFDSRIGFGSERGLADLGSRLALLSAKASSLAVWPDTRYGTPASGKQDLVRALVVLSDPARLPGWARSLLRYGGIAVALVGLLLLGAWLRGARPGRST